MPTASGHCQPIYIQGIRPAKLIDITGCLVEILSLFCPAGIITTSSPTPGSLSFIMKRKIRVSLFAQGNYLEIKTNPWNAAMIDYQRIAKAITYIGDHAAEQPRLQQIAKAVHLSPFHFHRLFREWAGVTPHDFLQYISIEHAKRLLAENRTVEEASFRTGLSSSSRLHDMFVKIEGMTPGEYKNGGTRLHILYHFADTPFGKIIVASTERGICNLLFVQDEQQGMQELRKIWPRARMEKGRNNYIDQVVQTFSFKDDQPEKIKLHIRGSDFQIKVWEALLKIPSGQLASYSDVARRIDNPRASRAVGSALARNPVAWLIPCHRVIKQVGAIGEYRWGSTRKKIMIGWESAQASGKHQPERE